MFANRGAALRELAFTLAMLGILAMNGFAQSAAQGDLTQSRIDKRIAGIWLLLKQSNVMPSGFVPSAIQAVYIHDDGSMEGVGVNAATGALSPGCPLSPMLWGRKILWADSAALQFTQQNVQTKEPEVGEGYWRIVGDTLHLSLRNAFLGRWTEQYKRVSIGDSISVPLQIQADMQINRKAVRLVEVSSTPQGSVNVMQLDTATHITIHFEGSTESGQAVWIDVRVHDFRGPGEYQVDMEKPSGLLSIDGGEIDERKTINSLSRGTVTIKELNLETSRCRGMLDVHFDQKFGIWPTALPMHLTGSFDLPIWISTEYDIKSYRFSGPDRVIPITQ
jgi:hypothetical protein